MFEFCIADVVAKPTCKALCNGGPKDPTGARMRCFYNAPMMAFYNNLQGLDGCPHPTDTWVNCMIAKIMADLTTNMIQVFFWVFHDDVQSGKTCPYDHKQWCI